MNNDIGKRVGHRLKQLREARGLTQAQLATLSGKSVESISNFERGKVVTSLATLDQLARLLDVQLRDFFENTPVTMAPSSMSASAQAVVNALRLLPDQDIEILAGVAAVLESQQRRKG